MVETFAVASGKGGTGKTTGTLALGMALAEDHDVTVVDADTGMANLLTTPTRTPPRRSRRRWTGS